MNGTSAKHSQSYVVATLENIRYTISAKALVVHALTSLIKETFDTAVVTARFEQL